MTGFFGFSCLAKRLFWLCFPVVSGQEFLASGWFFSRVSPIPFLGLVGLFWVWCHPSHFWVRFGFFGCGLLAFLAFFPVSIVCQDFLVSFSCGFGPCVFVRTFCYSFNFRSSFLWRVGPCGQPSGSCFGPFFPFGFVSFLSFFLLFPIWCSCARTLVSFMCPRPSSRMRSRGCCRFWKKSLTLTSYLLFSSFQGVLSGSPLRS